MTDYGRRSARSSNARDSFQASQSLSPGFLNLLNPMSRGYQGYLRADQSVLEEDEEESIENNVEPRIADKSKSSIMDRVSPNNRATRGESSKVKPLRPNIHEKDDTNSQGDSSSDDGVPQSFMVEATITDRKKNAKRSKGNSRETNLAQSRNTSKKKSLLPTTNEDLLLSAMPPRPSEIHPNPILEPQPERKRMRSLDAYERALWNWINVYNLDAFLQDVYSYYDGGGIYCIALSRGLNLLYVLSKYIHSMILIKFTGQWDLLYPFQRFFLDV